MPHIQSPFFLPVRRLIVIACLAALSLLRAEPSRACSIAVSDEASSIPGCTASSCADELPRNAVFFANSIVIDGLPTPTAPVDGEAYWEPPALLAAGESVSAGSTTATVGDFLDVSPPAMSELHSATNNRLGGGGGCGASSTCDGVEVFELEATLGADDVAAASGLTLLVYLAGSSAEAADAVIPALRLLPPGSSAASPAASSFTAAPVDAAWVAVETMDQAGNRSARTPAIRISR